MMRDSYDLLKDHPVNLKRIAEGKRPANSIWLWGEGRKPSLENFEEKFGMKGCIVSAVDLLKGIGIGAGMQVPEVEGATGYIDTNFEGKAQAAVDALENGCDFVYIHIEAPDECGHRGEPENKVRAIEIIDEKVLPVLLGALEKYDDYKVMILPDHPNPIRYRTHTGDPVPYVLYDSTRQRKAVAHYNEKEAAASGNFEPNGHRLLARLIQQ
jgi:2,3-bisphosphoglycerate-independent phosphoglycerate mutase